MNYKIGDKVQLYSWDELVEKYKNGFKVKSDKWYNRSGNLFGIGKREYIKLSNDKVKIIKLDKFDFKVTCDDIYSWDIPYEWIKENLVSLPDELFRI